MIFDSVQDASSSAYVSLLHYGLPFSADPEGLRQRWNDLAEYHPVLRTRFRIDREGTLRQEFPDDHFSDVIVCSLSHLPSSEQDPAIPDYFKEARNRGLNPFADSLCQLVLFVQGGSCREIGLVFHHAVLDGWSVSLLLKQLLDAAGPDGKSVPFSRYIRFLEKRGQQSDQAHWKNRLNGITGNCRLPGSLPGNPDMNVPGRSDHEFRVSDSVALHSLARTLRLSSGRVLQAIWALLLCRYNGGRALFGNIIAGRMGTVPGVTDMVGMCVNTIPVRVELTEEISFSSWIRDWSREVTADERHGFAPVAKLRKHLPGGVTYTDHLFVVDPPLPKGGPSLLATYGESAADFIAGFELEETVTGTFSFNPRVYDTASVQRTADHFCNIVSIVTQNPDILLKDISFLPDSEIRLLLHNEPAVGKPGSSLVRMWLDAVDRFPDADALVCGRSRLTYAALAEQVDKLAGFLVNSGVAPGDRVALKLARSERVVVAMLAVLRAGAAYLPMAPEWPVMRVQRILDRTSPALVLDDACYERFEHEPDGDSVINTGLPDPADPAYVIMTSGTTGEPKGVVVEHRNVTQFCSWAMARYHWKPGARSAVQTRFAYDVAIWGVYPALFSGGTVHILEEDIRNNLHRLRDYLHREQISHLDLPVAMAEEFMARFSGDEIPSSLTYLATGGDALRSYTQVPYTVVNEYGPTECTVTATAAELTQDLETIPIGEPLPGMRAHILDSHGRLCPLGVEGELCFSGVQLARGYLGDAALTAEKFVPNPFFDPQKDGPEHQRLYRTGDRACWGVGNPRGSLAFLGRVDQQIKVRGFRVEPGEVEYALQSHPKIQKAVVAVRSCSPETEGVLCAWVVCDKTDFHEDALRFFLVDKLPVYMLPVLIRVDALPLTAGGKVDFNRLPSPDRDIGNLPVSPPANRAEKVLMQTLAGLISGLENNLMLGFLDAGGDSINAIRLAARMEQHGWRMALPDIMAAPSLRILAGKMEPLARPSEREPKRQGGLPIAAAGYRQGSAAWLDGFTHVTKRRPSAQLQQRIETRWGRGAGVYAPTSVQKMLLTQSALLGTSAYAVLGHYRLPVHATDPEKIHTRLKSVMARHDILRAGFIQDGDGEPWMIIPEHREAAFRFYDYSNGASGTRQDKLAMHQKELEKGLDPFKDRLISMTLFDFGEDHLEMLLHYHHVILDGWSLELLFDELFSREDAEVDSAPAFSDYVQWTHNHKLSNATTSGPWWEKRFPPEALPADLPAWPLPDSETGSANGSLKTLPLLEAEIFSQCKTAARIIQVTPAALFMALWNLLLERYTAGGADGKRIFGFVSAGRPPLNGIEKLVGMCSHTLPVLLLRSGNMDFSSLARQLLRNTEEIRSRHDMPESLPGRLPRHLFSFESKTTGNEALPLQLSVSGEDDYDLVVAFSDDAVLPAAHLRFNPAAVSPARAGQLQTHFQAMVKRLLGNPELPASEVAALPAEETNRLLEDFGKGKTVTVAHKTVIDAFHAAAGQFPDYPALIFEDEPISFAELDGWTHNIACRLRTLGAGRGKVVAAVLSRGLAGAAAPLAIMKSGGAYFPLDPSWPEERINTLLTLTSAAVVVTDRPMAFNDSINTLTLSSDDVAWQQVKKVKTKLLPPAPDDLGYVICTSGTTGRPKATALEHRALANQVAWTRDRFRVDAGDRILHTLSFSFDPSLWLLFPFWAAGAGVEIVPLEMIMDSGRLLTHLHQKAVTLLALPARVGGMLFDHVRLTAGSSDGVRRLFPQSLRTLVLGGEVPKGLAPVDFEVVNAYGPTEACIQATEYLIPDHAGSTRIIGRPVANMRAWVLDSSRHLCPVGVEGELCLSGPQLAREYLDMPGETAAVFVANPCAGTTGHDRIYCTGDRVRWLPDGNLEFLGRIDGQIKIRGHRIELAEVQDYLQQAPGVGQAHVLVRDDEASGKRLDAYYIEAEEKTSQACKRDFLRRHLPGYMVPVTFTSVRSWPLNRNGKLDPSALPVPAMQAISREKPRNEKERALARAWEAVLGISRVSREDNFFDLGGHSLLLLNVIGHLSSTHTIDLRDFFRTPVLRELAATMRPNGEDQLPKGLHKRDAESREESIPSNHIYETQVAGVDLLNLDESSKLDRLLLTGATGYLGAFLLREYYEHTDAQIILPVRGVDPFDRLFSNLAFYFGKTAASAMVNDSRLDAVSADLSRDTDIEILRENLKDRPIDLILHSAAAVNHYGSPDRLMAGNVRATENLLELAQDHDGCNFAHISTLGAVNRHVFTELDRDLGPPALNVYSLTKQLAEKAVFKAGEQGRGTMIFRTGNLVLDYENGKSPRVAAGNMFLRLARMIAVTGLGAQTSGKMGYTFVDQAARAIRFIAQCESLQNKGDQRGFQRVFHIDNPHKMTLPDVLSMALPGDAAISLLPGPRLKAELEILARMARGDKGAVAKEYLAWVHQHDMEVAEGEIFLADARMDWTLAVLKRLGFSWKKITPQLASAILNRALTLSGDPFARKGPAKRASDRKAG